MATKLGRVVTYLELLPPKYHMALESQIIINMTALPQYL